VSIKFSKGLLSFESKRWNRKSLISNLTSFLYSGDKYEWTDNDSLHFLPSQSDSCSRVSRVSLGWFPLSLKGFLSSLKVSY